MKSGSHWWLAAPLSVVIALAAALWLGRQSNAPTSVTRVPAPKVQAPGVADAPPPEVSTPVSAATSPSADEDGPCTTGFTKLLETEEALASKGIVLSMGYAPGEPSVRIPPPCPGFVAQAFLALTPHGVEPLSADTSRAQTSVPWGCGDDIPAVALTAQRPVEKGNVPLAIGAAAAELLRWSAAKPVEGSADCPVPRAEFTREAQQLFEFAGREGRWALETWKLPTPPDLPPADDEASYRRVVFIDVWSRIGTDGTCTSSGSSERNEDGMPVSGKPRLRSIYGLLTLEGSPSEQKAWLLFDSPGYEGQGVAAIPFEQQNGQILMERADASVYSGC
jgi:hypothetical protein